MRCARHEARTWETRSAYKVLDENLVGKSLLWRPSCEWNDNIKMNNKIIDFEMWTELIWHRYAD
jgi:hypothetical protein